MKRRGWVQPSYSESVSPTLLQHISDRAPSLSKSERRVADYVLEHRNEVVHSTLAVLSSAIGVSEPTVIRFCASMGFPGFQAFRLEMARFLALGVPVTHSAITENDSVSDIATKIFDHTIASLDHTRRSFDVDQVVRAAELVEKSSRLHFFGIGASAIVAEDAQQKSVLFGRPCTALADPHQQFMEAATADTGDLFVFISHTGHSAPLPTVAEEAKANGARLLTITGVRKSPLAQIADVSVITETIEDTDVYTPTISRLTALVVIDVLATLTAMRDDAVDLERLRGMKQKLATFRSTFSLQEMP